MSSQKGNISRNRAQKHQNATRFQNDKYDTSKETKKLNSMTVTNLCERCKSIIEWKIKFKKYKPLTIPRKCIKCEQKCVMKAYHTICDGCAEKLSICAKCANEPTDENPHDRTKKAPEINM